MSNVFRYGSILLDEFVMENIQVTHHKIENNFASVTWYGTGHFQSVF